MTRIFFFLGALSAFLGVAAGAFGSHVLEGRLAAEGLSLFELAVRYQMVHAFGLIAAAWAHRQWTTGLTTIAGWLFVLGTILFSGSLYALSLSGVGLLGAITPFGGTAFLAGWGCLAGAAWRSKGERP